MALRERASRYPDALFSKLDDDLQALAREAHDAHVGIIVPPVLSIVLARVDKRERILDALLELRREWQEPRARAWALIDELRRAETVKQMRAVERELEAVSGAFSPGSALVPLEPARVLWNLVVDAVTAGITLAAGDVASAVTTVVGSVTGIVGQIVPGANFVFRRGAFDLARRVPSEILLANRVPELLDRLLKDEERQRLQR